MYSDEYFLFDGADFGAHASTDYGNSGYQRLGKIPSYSWGNTKVQTKRKVLRDRVAVWDIS